jgi:thioredoxin 1
MDTSKCSKTRKVPNFGLVITIALLALLINSATITKSYGKAETLTSANFVSTINGTDMPILVDFWAPWCGPCVTLGPTIDELANKTKGRAIVAKVNIDEHPALAQAYNVQAIPTMVVLQGGQVQTQLRGVQPLEALMATLEPLMSGSSSPRKTGGKSMIDRLNEATGGN